ncbi:MAG: hypothetical protein R3D62_01185 [Xanthobacteraceae bacterium]
MLPVSKQGGAILAFLIILVNCAFLIVPYWPDNLVNCDMECGETLLSLGQAEGYLQHGLTYGLLENYGTYEHPRIYTHNVNIGELTFTGLAALGLPQPYWFLLPLLAHGLGLWFVFLTVRKVTKEPLTALVALALFAVTYWTIGAYALNPLRAWHLPGLFITIYYALGLAHSPQSLRPIAGALLGAIISFGCGYDFWIISGLVATCVVLANARWERRTLGSLIVVAAVFIVPFILRQIHIAAVMGAEYWLQDVIYSTAIKVPFASMIIKIPSLAEIDAFYNAHQVLRPPASPTNSVSQILNTFYHMVDSIVIPRWGWLSIAALAFGLLSAAIPATRDKPLGTMSRRLLWPVTLGTAVGLAVFAPFSLHVYLKHEMPLVGYLFLLAKAGVFMLLVGLVLEKHSRWAIAVLVILAIDYVGVYLNNRLNGPAQTFEWTKVYEQFPNERIAMYVRRLDDDKFLGFRKSRSDVLAFTNIGETRANILVYQPVEQFVDFDAAFPRCNWTGWIRALIGWTPTLKPHVSCIYGYPLKAAGPQPTLDEFAAARAAEWDVVELNRYGIGYVILQRKTTVDAPSSRD